MLDIRRCFAGAQNDVVYASKPVLRFENAEVILYPILKQLSENILNFLTQRCKAAKTLRILKKDFA